MVKKTRSSAVFNGRCPRCRDGNIFKTSVFTFNNFTKMNPRCPNCNLDYEVEPGFFYGALYISYIFSVGIFAAVTIILFVFFDDPESKVYITTVIVLSIIFYPFNYRFSRIIYLHLFGRVKYDDSLRTS
jgi:uncharacterized protein (DUF983 family)